MYKPNDHVLVAQYRGPDKPSPLLAGTIIDCNDTEATIRLSDGTLITEPLSSNSILRITIERGV